jgi:hypothetical protein
MERNGKCFRQVLSSHILILVSFLIYLYYNNTGNVVRVVNSATVEFPLTAWVEPYIISSVYSSPTDPVIGGDDDSFIRQW